MTRVSTIIITLQINILSFAMKNTARSYTYTYTRTHTQFASDIQNRK